jgi:7-cyano-7-deazaguanine synthase
MKTVKLFWTGGYDFTYRLIELSFCKVIIQPFYLCNERLSESLELEAMHKIRSAVIANKACKATIAEPIIVPTDAKKHYDDITEAFERLSRKDFFGTQYEWLAAFARDNPGVEISTHNKITVLIEKYGELISLHDADTGVYYAVDKNKSSKDINILFGNYSFPISKRTKLDMKSDYIKWGYKDVMGMTWFCYNPKGGKPCGLCNPCMYAIQEGMKERLPPAAKIRYSLKRLYLFLYKIKTFLLSKIKK